MKRCRPCTVGLVLAGLGAVIILALVLPSSAWWFALGAAMIVAGLVLCKRRF